MKEPKFEVLDEGYHTVIRDTNNQVNFCVLCESSIGLSNQNRNLAEKICNWLNSYDDKRAIPPHPNGGGV